MTQCSRSALLLLTALLTTVSLPAFAADKNDLTPAELRHAAEIGLTADQVKTGASRAMMDLLPKDKSNTVFLAALVSTYQNNPTLKAARSETRAVFERLPQAEAGWRPTITANANVTGNTGSTKPDLGNGDDSYLTRGAGLNLNQPLYRGGRTTAETSAARNVIRAQIAALDLTEQQVLLSGVTAYLDVLRDDALLTLATNNQNVITQQLDATRQRFEVGELTRTDVSQSEARKAGADSSVITAKATIRSSRATFERIIGYQPENLGFPITVLDLPKTLDEAVSYAEQWNPRVRSAEHAQRASEDDVDSQFGNLLPTVSLTGDLTKSYEPTGSLDSSDGAALGVVASMPLYEASSVRSRVREAKKVSNQRHSQILEAKRQAREQVVVAWENLAAARAEVVSRLAQVEASEVARFGVKQEADLGSRTVLDTLDAEQELLDAQVALVGASRNEVVAMYSLAAALGVLTPKTLGFGDKVPDYDREIESVRMNLFGTGVDSSAPAQ